MMTFSFLYFFPSLIVMLCPLIMLFKRKIINAQWICVFYHILLGFSFSLYATYFNPDLRGEYMLSIIFAIMALVLPILFYLYVCKLSITMGVAVNNRRYFFVPVIMIGAMIVVDIIGGRGVYRDYLDTAVYGSDARFTDSIMYNLLLFVNYYLFLIVLVGEVFVVVHFSMKHLSVYGKMLDHYGVNHHPFLYSKGLLFASNIVTLLVTVMIVCIIIFSIHNLPLTIVVSVLLCLLAIYSTAYCYFIEYSVEDLIQLGVNDTSELPSRASKKSREEALKIVQDRLVDYVENKEAYCNTELSLSHLADYLRVTPNDVVNIIQGMRGCSYVEYIDSLRINKSIMMILSICNTDSGDIDRTKITSLKIIEDISRKCGYHSISNFYLGFQHVVGQSFFDWFSK